MKTFTIEAIQKEMNLEGQRRDILDMADTFRDSMDYEKALALMGTLTRKLERTGADINAWTMLDRISWYVREAYVAGQISGYDLAIDMQQAILSNLDEAQ